MTVVLISCCSLKADYRCAAEYMYISPLFKKSLEYARSLTTDENIFILSAKHHLIPLDQEIDPYNVTLNTMKVTSRKEWAEKVNKQISEIPNISSANKIIILAGQRYREFLDFPISSENVICPFYKKTIGKILHWLDQQI